MLFLGPLGVPETILIVVLALLLFGPKKIPELGRSLGKGLREFKKGTSGLMDELNSEIKQPYNPQQQNHHPAVPQQQAIPAPVAPVAPVAPAPAAEEEVIVDLESNKGKAE